MTLREILNKCDTEGFKVGSGTSSESVLSAATKRLTYSLYLPHHQNDISNQKIHGNFTSYSFRNKLFDNVGRPPPNQGGTSPITEVLVS